MIDDVIPVHVQQLGGIRRPALVDEIGIQQICIIGALLLILFADGQQLLVTQAAQLYLFGTGGDQVIDVAVPIGCLLYTSDAADE